MADDTRMQRRTVLRAAGGMATAGMVGVSGCLGGSDDDDGNGNGNGNGDGNGSGNGDDLPDFGGESLHVMLNAGALAEHQRQNVIPRVEEKYNLEINDEQSTTGAMITAIQSNPENPPDVIDVNVNGIFQAHRNDWLASFADHTDILTNYEHIYDEAKYYDDHGVSWYFGELSPVINTDHWDEIPTSWEEVIERADNIAMAPFAWTQGEFLLLASSIATGEPYDAAEPDVDAGFEWMEEHIKPKHTHTIEGIAQANQLLTSGEADVLLPAWDIWVTDLYLRGTPIRPVRRPDPVGIAAHQGVAVPEAGNVEPAMAYVNELLSLESQEEHPGIVGTGQTHRDATLPEDIQEFGAPTIDDVRDGSLKIPNYEFMWQNQDGWSEQWNQIFAE
ncbi:hypothetical protein [Natronosalvus amylolyticus]|uniref:hypothetical protein n=1 Tax=Natronosalvus amylolyticus TaxID=2961994 RepID=UPI0020C9DB24|nr:hypothetical protein [Natronosalvus amylolyticus]